MSTDLPTLCPACLTELPEDYPYDHVLIDRALNGRPDVFRAMDQPQRREVVRTVTDVRRIMGEGTSGQFDAQVAELWRQELTDSAISMRLGCHYSTVTRIRQRLGLPTLYDRRARRTRTEVTA